MNQLSSTKQFVRNLGLFVAAGLLTAWPADAANKFWPTAANGPWDTTSTRWSLTSGGTANQPFATSDNAILDKAGTYNLTNTVAVTAGNIFYYKRNGDVCGRQRGGGQQHYGGQHGELDRLGE